MLYSDINKQTDPILITDAADVHQSLLSIIGTAQGERLFNPEFGATPSDMLFEVYDDTSALLFMNRIYTAVLRWEPRATLHYSKSSVVADMDNHTFRVSLSFSIKGLENQIFNIEKLISM